MIVIKLFWWIDASRYVFVFINSACFSTRCKHIVLEHDSNGPMFEKQSNQQYKMIIEFNF